MSMLSEDCRNTYTKILRTELLEATGCTEPIAVALCAAKAREVLGSMPDRITLKASGNIIKNVKAVIVPNSGGRKGLETACLLGTVAGKSEKKLLVISEVDDEDRKQLQIAEKNIYVKVEPALVAEPLYIEVIAEKDGDTARCIISGSPSHFSLIEKDAVVLEENETRAKEEKTGCDMDCLNLEGILEYGETVDLEEIRPILEREIRDNMAISDEGLKNDWGEKVGKTLLEVYGDKDVRIRAKARAAAGSDARMNGCAMPVVINSGSGNQGMTVSLPVLEYARELNCSEEKTYRALAIANLVALHQKRYIGYLSAYCGAVSAAAGAGCAICWLKGGTREEIADTLTNAIATISGMVCDGAKSSCAGKIALSVDAAITGMEMAMRKRAYRNGEGLVKKDADTTVRGIGKMAAIGMKETDHKILEIMLEES